MHRLLDHTMLAAHAGELLSSDTSATRYRAILRILVTPILLAIKDEIADAINASPLIKKNGGALKLRPSYAALRDSLSTPVLVALVAGEYSEKRLLDAVRTGKDFHVYGQLGRDADLSASDVHRSRIAITMAAGVAKPSAIAPTPTDTTTEKCMSVITTAPTTASETDPKDKVAISLTTFEMPASERADMIDLLLTKSGIPTLSTLRNLLLAGDAEIARLNELVKDRRAGGEITLRIGEACSHMPASEGVPELVKIDQIAANKVFPVADEERFNFPIPIFVWARENQFVPEIDEHYLFRDDILLELLYALLKNQPVWLVGDTGTGKTTLIEQVAARMKWMVSIVNFDSDISRMDFIGRDTLVASGGTATTRFVDGVLPQAMVRPCIFVADEADRIQPGPSYVFQRVLQDGVLVISEDGGRIVQPHPMFRIVATANTLGQGDEFGRYAGARIQSMALLDRFKSWIEVDYLSQEELETLLSRRTPSLPNDIIKSLAAYAKEHFLGFRKGDITMPISPRALQAAAEKIEFFLRIMSKTDAVKKSLASTILNRANYQDRNVMEGLITRIFA